MSSKILAADKKKKQMRKEVKRDLVVKVVRLLADEALNRGEDFNCVDALDICDAVQEYYKGMILVNTREAFGLPEPQQESQDTSISEYFDLPF